MAKWKKVKIGEYFTYEDEKGEQLKDEAGKVVRFKDCSAEVSDGWAAVKTVGGWTYLNLDTKEARFSRSRSKNLSALQGSYTSTSAVSPDGWVVAKDRMGYRLLNVKTGSACSQVFSKPPVSDKSLDGWFVVNLDQKWCLYNAKSGARVDLTKYTKPVTPTSKKSDPELPLTVEDGWVCCNGKRIYNPEFLELSMAHPGKSLEEILRENPLEFEKLPTSYFTPEKRDEVAKLVDICRESIIETEIKSKDELEYDPEVAVAKVNELGGVVAEKIEREHAKLAELAKADLVKKGAAAKAKVQKHIDSTFDEIIKKL